MKKWSTGAYGLLTRTAASAVFAGKRWIGCCYERGVGGRSVAHLYPQTRHSHWAGSEGVPLPVTHRTCPAMPGSAPVASQFGQSGMMFITPLGRRPVTGLGYVRVTLDRLAKLLGIEPVRAARGRGGTHTLFARFSRGCPRCCCPAQRSTGSQHGEKEYAPTQP